MASGDRMPRFMGSTSASKARRSIPLTPEPEKATPGELFASVKAHLGFGSSSTRVQIDPLQNARAYKDIAPASEHPRARGHISTPISRLPTPGGRILTPTVISSPITVVSSPLTNKSVASNIDLPGPPIVAITGNSPKVRRSIIDAEERPLSRVVSPASKMSKEETGPILSPAQAQHAATTLIEPLKEAESAKQLNKNKALPRPPVSRDLLIEAAKAPKLEMTGTRRTRAEFAEVTKHAMQLDSPVGQKRHSSTTTQALRAEADDNPQHTIDTHKVPRLVWETHSGSCKGPTSANRVPSLETSFSNMHLSSTLNLRETKNNAARLAAAKERHASEKMLSPAEVSNGGTTQLPDPFRQKAPARNSGAYASYIPVRAGTPGPDRTSRRLSQLDNGRRSPSTKLLPNTNIKTSNSQDSMNVATGSNQSNSVLQTRPSTPIRQESQSGSDASDGSLTSISGVEESKQGFQSRRLSSKYGPLLTVSDDAEHLLLGVGSDADSNEDLKTVKHRNGVSASLTRSGSALKDTFRKSIHGIPSSLTKKSISKVDVTDEASSVDKSKDKAVPDDINYDSAGRTSIIDFAPFTSRFSDLKDLNNFADEPVLIQDHAVSWPLGDRPLPSNLPNTDDDNEDWISPLRPSVNAMTKSEPAQNNSSSPTPFPVPNSMPAQTSKTPKSSARSFVNKILRKKSTMVSDANLNDDVLPNDPAALAHHVLELAREDTSNRKQLLALGAALVAAVTAANNARLAREQVQQALARADLAVMQCEQAIGRALAAAKEIVKV